jgi:pimeloyl-ACP methyl ester carboxylesterase
MFHVRSRLGREGREGELVQKSMQKNVQKKYAVVFFFLLFILAFPIMFFLTPDLNREDLEARYAKAPSQFEVIRGLRVHFRDTGPKGAPVIVMLHGFGSSLQTWDVWSKALESDHRIIRMDLAGFGLTGAVGDGNYSDEADVERLEHFIQANGIQEFTLIGHSMGGRIAWNYASVYPHRVKSLVLLAPDGYPPRGQKVGEKPYDVGPIAEVIQWVMPKFLVKKSIEPAFYYRHLISDELVQRYYDMLRAPTVRQAILARMRQTINSDPQERLKKIQAPTLLLWGQEDVMIPCDNSEDYLKAIRQAKVEIFPRAGHLLQEENPSLGLERVIDFLKENGH